MIKKKAVGKVIEPSGCEVQPHERLTAKALADTGLTVEFIPRNTSAYKCNPDVKIGNQEWEMKSPKTGKLNQIQNNLKKANRQASHIIIDSQRVKKIPDKAIQAFLTTRFNNQKSIKKLLFVNRKRQVVDIKRTA